MRVLVATAVRVDPVRAALTLLLTPVLGGATALSGVGVRLLVDAAVTGDRDAALWVGGFLALTLLAVYQIGMVAAEIRLVLQTKVAHSVEQHAIALVTGPPTIEHHEDAGYLDRLELLRHRRLELSGAFGALVENVRAVVELGAVVAVLGTAHPALALLPLAAVPTVLAGRHRERLVAAADSATSAARRRAAALRDVACDPSAAREVRVCTAADELRNRHYAAVDELRRVTDRADTRGAVALAAGWATFALGLAVAVTALTAVAVDGRATAGDVALALTVGTQLAGAVGGILLLVRWLGAGLRAAGDYVWLVDHESRTVRPPGTRPVPRAGDVVLDAVTFRYPGAVDDVLREVSLRLPAGSTVALVGENGAGKSTLVKLLCGFYRPTGGTIRYGGRDLRDVDPAAWYTRLTACFQDFARLELSVRECVGVGDVRGHRRPGLPAEAELRRSLAAAGALRWAEALPEGLDTPLGSASAGAVRPSAGQWQRLALARAAVRHHPALLVLDEPSASLDPISELGLVQQYIAAVRAASPETVILLVSHRFTTVQHADLVVVLEDGKVVESGSHDDLVTRGDRYSELHHLHAGLYPVTVDR